MSINATNTGVKKEIIPSGNYVARCYSMIHVGTSEENIMGEYKTTNKVRITWELPTELRVFNEEKGEQPMVISQEFNLSMHEKSNLRKFLESWRGQGFSDDEAENFDITKLLGIPCMINIIHKLSTKSGNQYAIISNVSAIPKGMNCPPQINPTFEFNFEDKFSIEVLESFPDFIKDKIKASDEYKKLIAPNSSDIADLPESDSVYNDGENNDGSDLPF